MIHTLEELQKWILEGVEEIIYNNCFLMTSPGCDPVRLKHLKDLLPLIPQSYIDVIKKYSICGIRIYLFSISPCSFNSIDIVEGIIKASEDPFFPQEFMDKHHMLEIGSYSTDLICLTQDTPHSKGGEILFVDEGHDIFNPQDSQIYLLAKNFEQFLILTANYAQVNGEINENDSNLEEKKLEFLRRLEILNVNKKYHKAWFRFF